MTQGDLNAGKAAVRAKIDESGYGAFVDDYKCELVAWAVIEAVDKHRAEVAKK